MNEANKETARKEILRCLRESPNRLAVHEMAIPCRSQNYIATEVSIMAHQGLLEGRYRAGKHFKEWALSPTVRVKECAPWDGKTEAGA